MRAKNQIALQRAIFLWVLANLFFAFKFIIQLTPGILREEIMLKYSVDAASFGTLAGYYYLGYAGGQIPLGIMLDRLSFRFVTAISIFMAALGTYVFVASDQWSLLLLGRFFIGFGSGVSFLAVTKIINLYFDPKYRSMLIGASFSIGLTGAVLGTAPMQYLFNEYGYDTSFIGLVAVCVAIGIVMMVFGKVEKGSEKGSEEEDDAPAGMQILKLIFHPTILITGISGGLMVGSLEGFADVWGAAYFEQIFSFSKSNASWIISFIYIGMCFGGPILAVLAKLVGSENSTIFLTGVVSIVIFAVLFYSPSMSFTASVVFMFVLGILCCYQVLVFSVVSSYVSASNAGLAVAIVNCINMAFGHLFHQYIGDSITLSWDGALNANGAPLYTRDAYITALACIPIGCFIGQFGFALLGMFKRKRAEG